MAKIEKALPSVFGQPREAHLSVQHPGTPDVYASLSQGLRELGGSAQHIFDGLVRLGEEGQSLALEQARADYDAEVAERLDKEVYSLSGISAAEAGRKAESILQAAENRQLERLSAYGARPGRAFRNFAVRSGAAHLSRAVGYGRTEVRKATIDAGNRVMANSAKLYTSTGDASALDSINEAHARAWLASNGRLFDAEKLAAFDQNLKDGFVAWNGEKLRVVDKIAPGDKGVIARATAEDLRARLAQESSMYEQSRQDQIDLTHAARIDQLLKWGMLSEAEAHLANNILRPPDKRMSEGAFARAEAQLKIHREIQTTQAAAWAEAQGVIAHGAEDPKSQGGRYWTAKMDEAASETLKRLDEEAAGDERGLAARKRDLFRSRISAERAARNAVEKADTEQVLTDLAKEGLLDPNRVGELGARVAALPESPVKDFMIRMYTKKKLAMEERNSNNPEVRRTHRALVLEFKRCLAAGEPLKIGKVSYDLSNPEQYRGAIRASGFTPEDVAELIAYFKGRRLPINTMASVVAEALNQANGFAPDPEKGKRYFTEQSVLALCPQAVDYMEYVAKTAPEIKLDTKEGKAWLREQALKYMIARQASEPGWLYGFNTVLLHKFLAEGIDAEGNVVDGSKSFDKFSDLCQTQEQVRKLAQLQEDIHARAGSRAPDTVNEKDASARALRQGLVLIEERGERVWVSARAAQKKKAEAAEKAKAEERAREAAKNSLSKGWLNIH